MSLLSEVLNQSEMDSQSGLTLESIPSDSQVDSLIDSKPSAPQHEAEHHSIQPELSSQYTAEIAALANSKSRSNIIEWFIETSLVLIVCIGLYEYYSLNQKALVLPVTDVQSDKISVPDPVETPRPEVTPESVIEAAHEVVNEPTEPPEITPILTAPPVVEQAKTVLAKSVQYPNVIRVSVDTVFQPIIDQPAVDYQSRIDIGTASADDFAQIGLLYAQQLRWHDMRSAYNEAVKRAPERADYHFNLAISLERIKQPEAAVKHYQVVMNDPTHHAVAQQRINAIRNQK